MAPPLPQTRRAVPGSAPAGRWALAEGWHRGPPRAGPRRRLLCWAGALAAAIALAPGPRAQGFPARPLTLVVPYPAGGATDSVGRVLAQAMGQRLGQPVLVDNRPGAGTAIGAAAVAQAAPDGHTLLISSNTTFTINPALKSRLAYDPLRSFEAIGLLGSSPLVLLAHPALPVNDLPSLVAWARARPGALSWGSFGVGSSAHFAGELFIRLAGLNLVHLPYQGSAPAMQDLIAGRIQLSFDTNIAAIPQLKAGRVKALAVTSARRSPTLPGVPTIAEGGYPGYEMVPWLALVAPRGLPASVRAVLARALADSLADAATRAALVQLGMDVQPEPPEAYAARIAAELPRLRAQAYRAGIVVD